MKYLLRIPIFMVGVLLLQSCTKTESDFNEPRQETITVNASSLNVVNGASVSFTVLSSLNNNDVTADSKVYINGALISGSTYSFAAEGSFAVFATKGTLTSAVINVNVTGVASGVNYKHRVLVEEYSGTWCGNCPRILYGVDLLHQQTDKAVVVSTHLFNGDPFITTEGNNLAAQQGVSGVPTGYINRTISWTGPQYQNVNQVINNIQASSSAGLSIQSAVNSNTINITVGAAFSQPLSGGARLTVYLVEDKLFYTQRNYSSNLYGGQSSIPNFEYNGVIRDVVSALSGDAIGATGSSNQKTYSIAVPANVANINNTRIVAFITSSAGTVINVQEAVVGTTKGFETI